MNEWQWQCSSCDTVMEIGDRTWTNDDIESIAQGDTLCDSCALHAVAKLPSDSEQFSIVMNYIQAEIENISLRLS